MKEKLILLLKIEKLIVVLKIFYQVLKSNIKNLVSALHIQALYCSNSHLNK